jgi:hypothetical protein
LRAEKRAPLRLDNPPNACAAAPARPPGTVVHGQSLRLEDARPVSDRVAQRGNDGPAQPTVVEIEDDEFCPPPHPADAASDNRTQPPELWVRQLERDDLRAAQSPGKLADLDFDFGQFGHAMGREKRQKLVVAFDGGGL